jgi:hypothetical protein
MILLVRGRVLPLNALSAQDILATYQLKHYFYDSNSVSTLFQTNQENMIQ